MRTISAVAILILNRKEYCRRIRSLVYEVCQCQRIRGLNNHRAHITGCTMDIVCRVWRITLS